MYSSVLVVSALVVVLVGPSLQEATSWEGGNQGGGAAGFGGSQGFSGGQGGQGGQGRHGFNIVDTDEKYGYEANYPGGRANFFLVGPNRGPGAQRGSSQGGQGYQQGRGGGY